MQNKELDYITLSLGLSRCLVCTANAVCTVGISSAGKLIVNNFDKLWEGGNIIHFVPGCIPNIAGDASPGRIPGGVDAYTNMAKV